jgi:hypothetical protein
MTPTPSQEPVASERERFEAAWVKRGLLHPSRSSEPGYTDQYESPIAQNGWVMWQARAALSAPPAQVQGEAVALPFMILGDELAALHRFYETCEDGQDYDVPTPMMKRLAVIGLVRRVTGSRYEFTDFGLSVRNGDFSAAPPPAQAAPVAAERDPMNALDWAEYVRMQEALKGPKGYETWQDAATDERIRRVKAEKALNAAQKAAPVAAAAGVWQNIATAPTDVQIDAVFARRFTGFVTLTDQRLAARDILALSASVYRDRLLSALERAGAAETALRVLVDECDNDMASGWECRMNVCMNNARRLLAAAPTTTEVKP